MAVVNTYSLCLLHPIYGCAHTAIRQANKVFWVNLAIYLATRLQAISLPRFSSVTNAVYIMIYVIDSSGLIVIYAIDSSVFTVT